MNSPRVPPKLLFVACGLALLCLAAPATARRGPAPPRTVRDYFPPQDAQGVMDVALFRYKGAVLVAVTLHGSGDALDFLRYERGRWLDVTKSVLPVAYSEDNEYVLLRRGSVIRVTVNKLNEATQERATPVGKRIYDLVWSGGRFVVRR